MTPDSKSNDLNPNRIDYSAAMAKGVVGLVPLVGPLLAEIVGSIIPDQRIDRIAKFASELNLKLQVIEKSLLDSKLLDEQFTELIEEGFRQAARSLTDARRRYIATLIAKSVSSDDVEHTESKHLLRMLGEINDIEVIWLRFYRVQTHSGDKAFRETHGHILEPVPAYFGSSQQILNKATLQDSYKEHLSQLGLLEPRYSVDTKTNMPEFDRFSGKMKVRGYDLTNLGRLLLDEIGLGEDSNGTS